MSDDRPRDRIRAYASRELTRLNAWETELGQLYPRMATDRTVLIELERLLDYLDSNATRIFGKGRSAPPITDGGREDVVEANTN